MYSNQPIPRNQPKTKCVSQTRCGSQPRGGNKPRERNKLFFCLSVYLINKVAEVEVENKTAFFLTYFIVSARDKK